MGGGGDITDACGTGIWVGDLLMHLLVTSASYGTFPRDNDTNADLLLQGHYNCAVIYKKTCISNYNTCADIIDIDDE